jgi:hypothetical protein
MRFGVGGDAARQIQSTERTQNFQRSQLAYGIVGMRAAAAAAAARMLISISQVNTIISRVVEDRAKLEAKFAKKSKAEDAYHEKKEYVQEL